MPRILLIVLALLCACWLAVIGFGFVDDPGLVEDWPGWLGLAPAFFFAAHLPLERS